MVGLAQSPQMYNKFKWTKHVNYKTEISGWLDQSDPTKLHLGDHVSYIKSDTESGRME